MKNGNLVGDYKNVTVLLDGAAIPATVQFFKNQYETILSMIDENGAEMSIKLDSTWVVSTVEGDLLQLNLMSYDHATDKVQQVGIQFATETIKFEFVSIFGKVVYPSPTDSKNCHAIELNVKELEPDNHAVVLGNMGEDDDESGDEVEEEFWWPPFSSFVFPDHIGVGHFPYHLKTGASAVSFGRFFTQHKNEQQKVHWRDFSEKRHMHMKKLPYDSCINDIEYVNPAEKYERRAFDPSEFTSKREVVKFDESEDPLGQL